MSYTYLDLACDVLKKAPHPLIYQEIWRLATEQGMSAKLGNKGKTPWQSLGARLYVEVRDNPQSKIIPVGRNPMRFFLRERQRELPADAAARLEREEAHQTKKPAATPRLVERDLHPLLAYFAYSNPSFNRGRRIHTKTIFHEKSLKARYNEWIHPDMVGFYAPFEDWQPNVIEFNRVCDNNSLKLFSFELKRTLNRANYRESYFQAVSNSSWSHEGYLAAAEILDDDDFTAELGRLAFSFGIGIIKLDTEDVDASRVMLPARGRGSLDWDTVNKLCEQNPDFAKFLRDVKNDFEVKEIHPNKYDRIPDLPAVQAKRGSRI